VCLSRWIGRSDRGRATRVSHEHCARDDNQPAALPKLDQYARPSARTRREHDSAIAAFKRAAALDPTAGDVLAELSALYMRQNRVGRDHGGAGA
jgi:hypothetical protein